MNIKNFIDENCQILLVIGLPLSGKSTLISQLDLSEFIIFDDFVSYYFECKISKSIQLGQKVCLIDPRLCLFNIFSQYITEFQSFQIDGSPISLNQIKLILFENNPNQCLSNISLRCDRIKNIEKTIIEYSKRYDLKIIKPILTIFV